MQLLLPSNINWLLLPDEAFRWFTTDIGEIPSGTAVERHFRFFLGLTLFEIPVFADHARHGTRRRSPAKFHCDQHAACFNTYDARTES